MNYDPKMTANERVKQEKDGLAVWDDIFRYAKTGYASIADDDFARMRWFGMYRQKPNDGHFMWRIKLPGGKLKPAQLKEIGELANQYGRGFGDITTRQDIQLHWMKIEDFPDALDRVYNKLGLYTDFACGDTPRNVTACPLDGLIPNQIVPIDGLVQRVSDMFRAAGREFSNLPRKFKPSLSACPLHCHQPQINDAAMFGVERDGQRGLGVMVGGGLSNEPHFAQGLRVFLPQDRLDDLVPRVFHAICSIFRDSDELRFKRGHARLKYLVAKWGWERFRDELEKQLGEKLIHDDRIVNPSGALHTDHMGTVQLNNGLLAVGAPVPRGRITGDQMIAAANLAERFAAPNQGEIRLSQKQNFLLMNIPAKNVDALSRELDGIGLPPSAALWRQALVSCTGTQFCNLAVVETKERAASILRYLEQEVKLDSPIMVSVSGCPNACAQYQIADIGLTGIPVVMPDKQKVDGFNLFVGGCLGDRPEFGRELLRKVPAMYVQKVIAQLVRNYMANRTEFEDGEVEGFREFVARSEVGQLRAWAAIEEWTPAPAREKVG